MKRIRSLLITTMAAATACAQPTGLRTNHLTDPLGVDDTAPRLEWRSEGKAQATYSVTVGTDSAQVAQGIGSAWESGTVRSDARLVTYAGKPLQPFTVYYWRVETGDGKGGTEKSRVVRFETGLMGQWRGAWISDGHDKDHRAAPYFRKTFDINKTIKSARAYISAGGLFVLTVNGQRAGDHFLDPVYTRYDRRCSYVTFDITSLLRGGRNALGVVLGNGWYNHQALAVWDFDRAPWRNRPTFCMDVRITYTDGTTETVATDLSWRTSDGPLVYNNIYTGEHYDFNLVQKGWDTPQFDSSKWQGVRLRSAPAPLVWSQQMEPIRLTESISSVKVTRINDSTYVCDFGRNMAGVTEVRMKGEKGTRLRISHGERLHGDGTLDQSNIDVYYRGDKKTEPFQTDILTLSGGDDSFRAEFSYKGFRYVQVTADRPVTLGSGNITAHFTHSDVETAGSITSSEPLLDKTVQAARMAYISNLMGYPTDCPQREKNGWTGDGHLAIETAFYNYDAITVYEKWLADHRDEQQPNGVLPDIIPTDGWGYGTDNGLDWTSTIAIIPWNIYLFYGDMRPLAECYDNMKRYVDYVDSNSPEHLSAWGRGDWVPVKTQSDKLLTSSIYFFADATILSKAAALLGHDDDHRRYARLAADIRDAINARFLNRETAVYAGGSQTEMSLALMWKVVPDDMTRRVAACLAEKVRANDWHLDVGVHGAKAILNALSENGYAEDAYRIAVQDTYPSWGWWIVNGATTLLENWNLKATRDISDNHIMFGEIGAWPYKGLGGIFPDERQPGFRHINLRPNFVRDLRHFEASHNSPYGTIVSKWNRKGKTVAYTVTLPPNTTATLTIPGAGDGGKTVELEAGTHSFEIKDNGRYKRVSR